MKLVAFDIEVFKYDWLVVMIDVETNKSFSVHNNRDKLIKYIKEEDIYIGFNSKHYDRYILKGILLGFNNIELKELSDYILKSEEPWSFHLFEEYKGYINLNFADIKDDMQIGLSLKSIEGHLGLPIKESNIDFNIDRKLTNDEIEEVYQYCLYDVQMVCKLIEIRKDYLDTKILIGSRSNLSKGKSLSLTNAKLTSKFLNATRKQYSDEREYVYPSNLSLDYINDEVKEFLTILRDETVSNVFDKKLNFKIKNTPSVFAWGGLHGAIKKYSEISNNNRIILNFDVASYYPNLIVKNNYASRNILDKDKYKKVLEERLVAKNSKPKLSDALKLVLNTTYGATLNSYNDLYDPLMARSICISGQLYLIELSNRLIEKCKSIEMIQLNTDGIMFSIDYKDLINAYIVLNYWQEKTGFELEEERISKVFQKDVNNYLIVFENGKHKTKGAYFKTGINLRGQFSINNNQKIVVEAITKYLTENIKVEDTINNSNNILDFQIITKMGSTYSECYQMYYGEYIALNQKVNRVYATSDTGYGKIYKRKGDSIQKIANLPNHCIIDNENKLSINMIDKDYYIFLAIKRIKEITGKEYE